MVETHAGGKYQVMAHWDSHLKASKPPDTLEMHRVFANEQTAPGLVCTNEQVKALKLNFSYVGQLQISVTLCMCLSIGFCSVSSSTCVRVPVQITAGSTPEVCTIPHQ